MYVRYSVANTDPFSTDLDPIQIFTLIPIRIRIVLFYLIRIRTPTV
jgi:hypothetical protein